MSSYKVTIIIFERKLKNRATLFKVYSSTIFYNIFGRKRILHIWLISRDRYTREFFRAVHHENVPGGADFPERNNLSASNRAEGTIYSSRGTDFPRWRNILYRLSYPDYISIS